MKTLHLNPYTAGNPVSDPKGFFGREDVFREVVQMLRHPHSNAIVLYGQRRIGKTSVLLQLERILVANGEYTPVYLDLHDKASKPLSEMLYELAQHIVLKMGQELPERGQFDEEGKYFRQTFLPVIANAAAQSGLVLLFDEFDVLDSPRQTQAGQKFFPYLREWMSSINRVKFVFVIGRRPEDLSIETMSTFKGVRSARVSLIERNDIEAIIRQSELENNLLWSGEAVDKVWELTQGHPYFTQLLCSVVWEDFFYDFENSELPSVSAFDVEGAIKKVMQQGANAFCWLWDGLPPAERVIMAAIAEAEDEIIKQDNLVEILNRCGVRLIVRELELAPEILAEWELLRPIDNGYKFEVPILRHWVKHYRPLRRVKEELDRLDPLADGLFQTGRRYYSISRVVEAESQLRQALRINPNHLKSKLLLGRILLESGKLLESVKILEEAYSYDEREVRADLIKALLALTDEQNENQQLEIYERILIIDPGQPMAREQKRRIWTRRGEVAFRQNKFEEAIAAFREADDLPRIKRIQEIKRKHELEAQINLAMSYEASDDWKSAIDTYEKLLEELPNEADWLKRLEDAKDQHQLAKKYNEALGALESNDNNTARNLLLELVRQNPHYKEAIRYLFKAITNVDVQELMKKISLLENKLQEAEKYKGSFETLLVKVAKYKKTIEALSEGTVVRRKMNSDAMVEKERKRERQLQREFKETVRRGDNHV